MTVDWDPASPGFRRDPYFWYRMLRENDPVHRRTMRGLPATFLTRQADVRAVLRDPRFSAERLRKSVRRKITPELQKKMHPLTRVHLGFMLFRDPPDHTRLRKLVEHAFSPSFIDKMRRHMRETVHNLLDDLERSENPDLIRDVAAPLPVKIILDMFEIPGPLRPTFEKLSSQIAKLVDPTTRQKMYGPVMSSSMELREIVSQMIEERRRDPRGDLISALVGAREKGDMLFDEEIVGTVFLLVAAGHETTRNLIGNGSLALIQHPEERERLRSDPSLARSAVEELLRWDAPVQMTVRTAREEVEIDRERIPAGEEVYTLLGAANRDPAAFSEPERLDLGRRRNRHTSFGAGAHYCLGASLGRLEGELLFQALVHRFPGLALAVDEEQLEWCPGFVLRGLQALPVRW